jgi:hypothetical protein
VTLTIGHWWTCHWQTGEDEYMPEIGLYEKGDEKSNGNRK